MPAPAAWLQKLREIADEGTAVLLVTHDTHCEQYVDRSMRMAAGRLQVAV